MRRYETERLILRGLEREEWDKLQDYIIRNRNFLKEWEPLREESYYQRESLEKTINSENESYESRSSLCLYIFNKGEDRIIGSASLTNMVYGVFQSCFLGYKLDEREINQGKMTEALGKLIDIAFTEYGLHRIEANIMPRNIRSVRVAEKLGFMNEGLSRKYLKIMGTWEDHIHYVLLSEKAE